MPIFRAFKAKLALTLAALLAMALLFLLGAWLAFPWILQTQAQRFIAEKTGHRLSLDRPEFNPLEWRLRIPNLALSDPNGQSLLAFRALTVDLSAASLTRRALVFDDIQLEAPLANVALLADGHLNWSPLIEALKSKDAPAESSLPRLEIAKFSLLAGQLALNDQAHGFATRIAPVDLALTEISTLPDEKTPGAYQVSARTTQGARLAWQGTVALNPLLASGQLGIEALDLAHLAPYFKSVLSAPPKGLLSLNTAYRVKYAAGRFDLQLEQINAQLAGLRLKTGPLAGKPGFEIAVERLEAQQGQYDLGRNRLSLAQIQLQDSQLGLLQSAQTAARLLQLGKLSLEALNVDLSGRKLSLKRVDFAEGHLKILRNARGEIDLLKAWQAPAPTVAVTRNVSTQTLNTQNPQVLKKAATKISTTTSTMSTDWQFALDQLALHDFSVTLQDQSVQPTAELVLEDLHVATEGLTQNLNQALPLRAGLRVRSGGTLTLTGKFTPATAAADVQFKLSDLALRPAQPYLSSHMKLSLLDGQFAVEGGLRFDQAGPLFKGGFALRDLRLNETETDHLFLAWKSLASRDVQVSAKALEVGTLTLDGIDTNVLIDKDKSINIRRLRAAPGKASAAPVAPSPSPAPTVTASPVSRQQSAPSFLVNIDRLRVKNGELDFADQSLALPFGTRIHRLRGAVNGLSSRPGAPGQVELDGQVDEYGLARAVGQIDLSNPTEFTDLKVVFRNVEMRRLTPYSATFAGRKIESGKLSLNLEYKVKKRQLTGENQIIMDQLVLGERVASPEAKDLPLDLALAVLRDAEGRIDLGLPVSGHLDDPQFSYGGIVWKAILNVFGKIATAPFRMLGALLGGGEKVEQIGFETGRSRLTPPEQEKLVRLASGLNKRPALTLTVHGVFSESDRVALQERQLRRAVAEQAGQRLEKSKNAEGVEIIEDPGPLSTQNPKVQAALEDLYRERVGSSELAALKAGFRKMNPGQLEESATGKVMSRLSGWFREQRELDEQALTQLKGADFYMVLFEHLRERENVPDTRLHTLAKARGEHVLTLLKKASAPMERVNLGTETKVLQEEDAGSDIPLKLELGAANAAVSAR